MFKKLFIPSDMYSERTIIPPEEGWEENELYEVEVAYSSNNVIHRAIFFTGFLHNGNPSSYNSIFQPTSETTHSIKDAYYLRPIRQLHMSFGGSGSIFH